MALERVDEGGTYLCSGSFLNNLIDNTNRNEVKVLDEANMLKEKGARGTLLNAELLQLNVCVNGVSQLRNFWVTTPS